MSWLQLLFALELGLLPLGEYQLYEEGVENAVFAGSFYSEFSLRAQAYGFYAEGMLRTTVWKMDGNYYFWPERTLYQLGVGYRWKMLTVGFRHYCVHPHLLPWQYWQRRVYRQGAYEELFVVIAVGDGW